MQPTIIGNQIIKLNKGISKNIFKSKIIYEKFNNKDNSNIINPVIIM